MRSPKPVPITLQKIQSCKREKVYLTDGSIFYFDRGAKDDFCIQTCLHNNGIYMCHYPTDEDIFTKVLALADHYGKDKVWSDFHTIYEATIDEVHINKRDFYPDVIELIRKIASTYQSVNGKAKLLAEQIYTWIYLGMIAEYMYVNKNNQPSRLNKRIKELGIMMALETHNAKRAADSLRGHTVGFIKGMRLKYGLPED